MKQLVAILLVTTFLTIPVAHADETYAMNPPCRVLDTRLAGGGGFIFPWTSRYLNVRGTPGGSQGGAVDCGIPESASGVIVSVGVIDPTAAGWATLYTYGEITPYVTTVTTSGSGGLVTVSTTVWLPPEMRAWDLSLSLYAMGSHVVIDLVGYLTNDYPFTVTRHRLFHTFANAPFSPGGLTPGDTFIIQNGVGVFAGHDNEWVAWNGENWHFDLPQDGDLGYQASNGVYYRYRAQGVEEWRALLLAP